MTVQTIHTRSMSVDLKTRAAQEDEQEDFVIEGYFALFNTETELFPGFREQILPGAFDNALNDDIRALIDHDRSKVLGRTKSKTLELSVDSRGLFGTIKVNKDDRDAMNLYQRVKRGDVDQCSFGFWVVDEDYKHFEDGSVRSDIKDLKLLEVSVVTFPAYEDTSVSARAKDVEEFKKKALDAKKSRLKERMSKWH